jgi:hypothetical protein
MNLHLYRKSNLIRTQSAGSNVVANAMELGSFCSPSIAPSSWKKGEDVFINWGVSAIPGWYPDMGKDFCVNPPNAVGISANKRDMYIRFTNHGVPTYKFYTKQQVASIIDWFRTHQVKLLPEKLVARTLLSSHSGKGIEITNIYEDDFVKAPLYTEFTPTEYEIRVYIVNHKIIDYIQKKRMSKERLEKLGRTEADPVIKVYHNGWVFARNNKIPLKDKWIEVAHTAMDAVGLDFGVVDLGITSDDEVIAIETNSAPGMMHSDITKSFATAIKEMVS